MQVDIYIILEGEKALTFIKDEETIHKNNRSLYEKAFENGTSNNFKLK